ncbi:hypothetical protein CONPUDRAFT_74627 [Coniophora puteana RWD-64-598 SS2]|uniref:CxC2-like cysteine cluster KDZ transposase-associated domain-containing protein n=1 Tax=Coniophora puteana (strain RWD-64-598) TaxID=741705 RepID=A0A5M3MIS0_CONPW|nr:uncharacterized protein CONPUDRAFT_74627 [Coniophora puteana RWD-64-598 SS2]EIW79112.1 hypothetical protein CONPUDRAFT_74627 [Coniophora puteana RWD-64-598 SS2]
MCLKRSRKGRGHACRQRQSGRKTKNSIAFSATTPAHIIAAIIEKKQRHSDVSNYLEDDEDDDPRLQKMYTRVEDISRDGRRIKVDFIKDLGRSEPEMGEGGDSDDQLYWMSEDWEPYMDATDPDEEGDQCSDMAEPKASDHVVVTSVLRKHYLSSVGLDNPLLVWVGRPERPGYCNEYLNEYIRWEGCGNVSMLPCMSALMTKWNGSFFDRISLKLLGLGVDMGHEDGTNCNKKVPHRQQLLQYGWYPSTVDTPETACTEEALVQYSALMSRTKVSPHGYYQALETLTDPLGLDVPPVCLHLQFSSSVANKIPKSHYKVFLCILRQHGYIRLMKDAGHDTTGPGELAVACPACPHPNINLPEGWESADPSQKFLYCLFLAMDANFRLKNRNHGRLPSDIELFNGLAYFVKTGPYMDYV